MKEELFNEVLESVREGMAILRGEGTPSRVFVAAKPDVAGIRAQTQLSRQVFARRIGVSARTVRDWGEGKRSPRGPARVLLEVATRHPDAVRDVLHSPICIKQVSTGPKSKVA
jgi:putative transcriptional regulator